MSLSLGVKSGRFVTIVTVPVLPIYPIQIHTRSNPNPRQLINLLNSNYGKFSSIAISTLPLPFLPHSSLSLSPHFQLTRAAPFQSFLGRQQLRLLVQSEYSGLLPRWQLLATDPYSTPTPTSGRSHRRLGRRKEVRFSTSRLKSPTSSLAIKLSPIDRIEPSYLRSLKCQGEPGIQLTCSPYMSRRKLSKIVIVSHSFQPVALDNAPQTNRY